MKATEERVRGQDLAHELRRGVAQQPCRPRGNDRPVSGRPSVKLKNTSRYPDDVVRQLITIALHGVDDRRLAVNVKNSRRPYRGRTYATVPSISPISAEPDIERLVTIGIGAPECFPLDTAIGQPGALHGYGGRRSPIITMIDWREALVAVAAHEARHVWQFQHEAPGSEIDAERFAAARLDEYRALDMRWYV